MLGIIGCAALAITSPLINTVDLIGSGVATLCQNNENIENDAQTQGGCCLS